MSEKLYRTCPQGCAICGRRCVYEGTWVAETLHSHMIEHTRDCDHERFSTETAPRLISAGVVEEVERG